MSELADGDDDGKGGRWCAAHGRSHGTLHLCPDYTDATKAKVSAMDAQFRANLGDPKWVAEQRAKGIPQVAIDLFKVMGGVKP